MSPLLIALALLAPTATQDDDAPASPAVGQWLGVLTLGPAKLTLVLHVEQDKEGELLATLDSPDQGAFGLEVGSISLEDRVLEFKSPKLDAHYTGTLSKDDKSLTGTFTQRGTAVPLTLNRTEAEDLPRPVEVPKVLLGVWQGPIKLPNNQELRVALRVEPTEKDAETLTAVFDSLDQGVKGIPITAVEVDGETVRFEVKSIAGSFEGTFDEDQSAIAGTWMQSGQRFPLTLKKGEKLAELKRPQHPKAPFPYKVEELTFENPEAGITLAGTLTIPEGDGPFPAAVLSSGSGPQDRDETLLGHKPFLVIADHLTRAGIAVLRFDDRGVGQSEGDHGTATSEDFATDALAAVRTLRSRPEIDGSAVGIIGHSEGGLIGPLAASKAPDEIGFLVLLAGPGVTGREIVIHQSGLIARATGDSEATIQSQLQSLGQLFELISGERTDVDQEQEIVTIIQESLATLSQEDREAIGETEEAMVKSASQAMTQFQSPWFRYFLVHDPRPTLQQVSCPVLALFGEKDLQVDPKQNADEIENALREGGNEKVTVEVLPGLNHLFQHTETGSPLEYGKIEETFAPEALDRLSSWVQATTQRE